MKLIPKSLYDNLSYINMHPNWKYFCQHKGCNKRISRRAIRCRKCEFSKNRNLFGKNNPNYGKRHKGLNQGKLNPMYGKPTPHGNWTIYNKIKFRSSWEANFAKWLDLSNIKWFYESKTFDLGNTTYTPDFYLPEFDCYIEIKGYWRDDARKKFLLFQEKYPEVYIGIFDSYLLNLIGIIK